MARFSSNWNKYVCIKHADFESVIYKVKCLRDENRFQFMIWISFECYVKIGFKPFTITLKL